jgi:transmembrane sensor
LAADIRHLGAYGRAEAVLARLERLSLLGGLRTTLDAPGSGGWNRRQTLLAGGAATVAATALGIAFFPKNAQEETFSTQIGQMREVVLPDDSVVSLNTDSQVSIQFTGRTRNIILHKGEALFEVTKDENRPFVVSVGGAQVRAVGTSFTVSLLPQKPIQVLVKEGIVELKQADIPEAQPVRATANVRAIISPNAPIVTIAVPEEELTRDLEWRHGRIAMDNETLADAVNEFARYSEIRITVDSDVSDRTVTGLFASNDPVGFAKTAATVLKLQTEVRGNEVRIFSE